MSERDALIELLWMLVSDAGTGALLVLLAAAAVIDWRTRRIPNWLTVGGMVYGLVFNATHATSLWVGLAHAGEGLALGLVVLFPLWLLRVMGAGDVKLMAMVGAFVGPAALLRTILIVFVVGGAMALAYTVNTGALRRLLANLRFIGMSLVMPGQGAWRSTMQATNAGSVGKQPFAVSIFVGTTAFLVARQLGFL